jgi:hypothetical protein
MNSHKNSANSFLSYIINDQHLLVSIEQGQSLFEKYSYICVYHQLCFNTLSESDIPFKAMKSMLIITDIFAQSLILNKTIQILLFCKKTMKLIKKNCKSGRSKNFT